MFAPPTSPVFSDRPSGFKFALSCACAMVAAMASPTVVAGMRVSKLAGHALSKPKEPAGAPENRGVIVGERVAENDAGIAGGAAARFEAPQGFVEIAVVQDALELAVAGALGDEKGISVISREPGTASPSLSLEDTSPPWSADAARPECGHYWRRPRDSEPPGHGAHPGPMCRAAENHSRNPS
jgi:hypothetical protein